MIDIAEVALIGHAVSANAALQAKNARKIGM
jgi:hypothetical protein